MEQLSTCWPGTSRFGPAYSRPRSRRQRGVLQLAAGRHLSAAEPSAVRSGHGGRIALHLRGTASSVSVRMRRCSAIVCALCMASRASEPALRQLQKVLHTAKTRSSAPAAGEGMCRLSISSSWCAGWDRVDLLKCDIEGAEELFLRNYPELLRRMHRAVFEFHHAQCDVPHCRDLLAQAGLLQERIVREFGQCSVEFFARIIGRLLGPLLSSAATILSLLARRVEAADRLERPRLDVRTGR